MYQADRIVERHRQPVDDVPDGQIARVAVETALDDGRVFGIVGLGRNFAWGNLVKGLPVVQGPSEIACGCYDGDE